MKTENLKFTEKKIDEMIKFEIESGNPFSEYISYKSYKSTGQKKVNKKEEAIRLGELLQKQLEENSLPF
jgi:hypothetical protein